MGKHRNRKKYKFVTINGQTKRAHRHIMEMHIGRKLRADEHVHHRDENGTNNDISNLEILPEKIHNQLSGRTTRTTAKLSIEEVRIVRRMLRDGIKQRIIAFGYGVNMDTINCINTGKTWSWA